MGNRDLDAAWKYHNATKHSYHSVHTSPHSLDWANMPLPYKVYPTLEVLRLERDFPQTGIAALSAIATPEVKAKGDALPGAEGLAQLLFFSAGITRHRKFQGGEIFFRAAACTGALYEIDLYLVCADLPGLSAGIYHFAPAEFALRQLRQGDHRKLLVQATSNDSAVAHAPLTIICTGTYWRNAWKYQARTYRHFGWDNGTLLANLLAVTTAQDLPAKVICGFADDQVNRLLDLNPEKEVAFSLVPIGRVAAPAPKPPAAPGPLDLVVMPVSRTEVDYPLMREMHTASTLAAKKVKGWRGKTPSLSSPASSTPLKRLQALGDGQIPRDSIEQVILRRGSTRRFLRAPLTLVQLCTLLDRATRGIPADFLDSPEAHLNDLYLIVNAVEGLTPGAYFYHWKQRALELLREGDFRRQAGYLGLEQELPADASVDIFFLADLKAILERFGNRGYRAVQLEAGILGGKLYLAAYAQGFGASGLTFYDADVVNFFSPHAQSKSAIFLMALGQSAAPEPRR
jgi:SagB-type dehydrogenase family enzyme